MQYLFYCGACTSGHPQRVVGVHAGRGQMLYCAQNEESNWCNGLLEVPPLIIVAVMLRTLAAGGKAA